MLAQLLQDFVDFPIKRGSAAEQEFTAVSSYILKCLSSNDTWNRNVKVKGA